MEATTTGSAPGGDFHPTAAAMQTLPAKDIVMKIKVLLEKVEEQKIEKEQMEEKQMWSRHTDPLLSSTDASADHLFWHPGLCKINTAIVPFQTG